MVVINERCRPGSSGWMGCWVVGQWGDSLNLLTHCCIETWAQGWVRWCLTITEETTICWSHLSSICARGRKDPHRGGKCAPCCGISESRERQLLKPSFRIPWPRLCVQHPRLVISSHTPRTYHILLEVIVYQWTAQGYRPSSGVDNEEGLVGGWCCLLEDLVTNHLIGSLSTHITTCNISDKLTTPQILFCNHSSEKQQPKHFCKCVKCDRIDMQQHYTIESEEQIFQKAKLHIHLNRLL